MLIDSFSLAEKSLTTVRYYQVLPGSRKIVALFVNKSKREKQKKKSKPISYDPAGIYLLKVTIETLEQVVK